MSEFNDACFAKTPSNHKLATKLLVVSLFSPVDMVMMLMMTMIAIQQLRDDETLVGHREQTASP